MAETPLSSLTRLMVVLISHWTYLLNLGVAGPRMGVLNNPLVFSFLQKSTSSSLFTSLKGDGRKYNLTKQKQASELVQMSVWKQPNEAVFVVIQQQLTQLSPGNLCPTHAASHCLQGPC